MGLAKVHILPLGQDQEPPDNPLQFLSSTLKAFRTEKTPLYTGKVFAAKGKDRVMRGDRAFKITPPRLDR